MDAATFKKDIFKNLIGGFWPDEPYKVFSFYDRDI